MPGNTNYEVMFDSVLLTSITGLSVLSVDSYKLGERTLTSFPLARSNQRKVNSAFYTEKHIMVGCAIIQGSRALLDQRMDELNVILQGIEKTLIIPERTTGHRSYTATLDNIKPGENAGGYHEFTLDFLCSDNFGYNSNFTSLLQVSGRTLYNYTDSLGVIGGSAPWQVPVIKITVTAVTGGTAADITIKNPATGVSMTISRTWAAGDLLTIDCQNKTVQVNGVDVDFTGGFPELEANKTGYLQYTDNFTTRTVSMFYYHTRRWL